MSDPGFASTDFGRWTVVLEDDGRVGYAYLLEAGEISSDVWLYNSGPASDECEWERDDAEELMPFANPAAYIYDGPHVAIREDLDWAVDWRTIDVGRVRVYIEGVLWAELAPGEAPGRSRLVRVDGPLGSVLLDREEPR